jgi:hypothetical protein
MATATTLSMLFLLKGLMMPANGRMLSWHPEAVKITGSVESSVRAPATPTRPLATNGAGSGHPGSAYALPW